VGSETNTGQILRESVGLLECIEKVENQMKQFTSGDLFAPRINPTEPYKVQAWGFAAGYKNTGLGGGAPDKAIAEVELFPDNTVEVRTSSAEIGQGLVTVLQLIAAEELNLPVAQVRVLLSDTDLTPDGGPTTASRQTYVAGNAVRGAAQILRQAIATTLAEKYDYPPEKIQFVEGLAQVDNHWIPLSEVAKEMLAEKRTPKANYEYWAPQTKPLGEGGDMHFAFSYGAQAAEVEVNTLTGEVSVLRIIAATDVGSIINPLGLVGQIEGGVIMGLGNALTEHFIVEEGRVFTDRIARYQIPSIGHSPEIIPIVIEHPTKDGPFGAKGIGEIVSIPTTPAITNAIYHAVKVRVDSLPVDQELILESLRGREN
ncbi:MAG: molybdopterin cofactor-binding domain-containing protein, partial [Anaerolineaceae bacterium]|nr:molybdopterin cofactor-binding domain-containing protein [Anaerolineaceae bacterium]